MGNREWISKGQLSSYCDAGFTVVTVDYRLAPESKLPEIVSDIDDAYAWMRNAASTRFGFDAARIAVMGASAGGYLALLTGVRARPSPRAVVSLYGYGELTGSWYSQPSEFYRQRELITDEVARASVGLDAISDPAAAGMSGRGDFYLYCRQHGTWAEEVCGHPASDRNWFTSFEPLRGVSADYPPTMLLHGAADTDVPIEESLLMRERLARHGVTHELVTRPDWGHAFDLQEPDDPLVVEAVAQVVSFLTEHTS